MRVCVGGGRGHRSRAAGASPRREHWRRTLWCTSCAWWCAARARRVREDRRVCAAAGACAAGARARRRRGGARAGAHAHERAGGVRSRAAPLPSSPGRAPLTRHVARQANRRGGDAALPRHEAACRRCATAHTQSPRWTRAGWGVWARVAHLARGVRAARSLDPRGGRGRGGGARRGGGGARGPQRRGTDPAARMRRCARRRTVPTMAAPARRGRGRGMMLCRCARGRCTRGGRGGGGRTLRALQDTERTRVVARGALPPADLLVSTPLRLVSVLRAVGAHALRGCALGWGEGEGAATRAPAQAAAHRVRRGGCAAGGRVHRPGARARGARGVEDGGGSGSGGSVCECVCV